MRFYIDSRHRSSGSSDSDFSVTLSKPQEFKPDTVGVVEQVILSNTFETITTGVNDKLYVRESVSGVLTDTVLVIQAGSYTPASIASTVSVLLNSLNGTYTCTVASTGNKLIITNTYTFPDHAEILTREQLVNQSLNPPWTGTGVNTLNYKDTADACAVIGLMSGTGGVYSTQMLLTKFVSLQPYRVLYLHSHFASSDSLGPLGQTTIIRCIPVTGVAGDVIAERHASGAETLLMPTTLSSMHFSLRDSNNKLVDTQGHPILITICTQE